MARLLTKLSKLQGRRRGEILSELLETVREPLERVAVLLQAAKDAPASALAGLRASAHQAEAAMLPQAAMGMGQLDFLIEQAKGAGARADSGAVAAPPASLSRNSPSPPPNPRVVTRGSGTPRQGDKGSRVVPIGRAGKGRKR